MTTQLIIVVILATVAINGAREIDGDKNWSNEDTGYTLNVPTTTPSTTIKPGRVSLTKDINVNYATRNVSSEDLENLEFSLLLQKLMKENEIAGQHEAYEIPSQQIDDSVESNKYGPVPLPYMTPPPAPKITSSTTSDPSTNLESGKENTNLSSESYIPDKNYTNLENDSKEESQITEDNPDISSEFLYAPQYQKYQPWKNIEKPIFSSAQNLPPNSNPDQDKGFKQKHNSMEKVDGDDESESPTYSEESEEKPNPDNLTSKQNFFKHYYPSSEIENMRPPEPYSSTKDVDTIYYDREKSRDDEDVLKSPYSAESTHNYFGSYHKDTSNDQNNFMDRKNNNKYAYDAPQTSSNEDDNSGDTDTKGDPSGSGPTMWLLVQQPQRSFMDAYSDAGASVGSYDFGENVYTPEVTYTQHSPLYPRYKVGNGFYVHQRPVFQRVQMAPTTFSRSYPQDYTYTKNFNSMNTDRFFVSDYYAPVV